MPIEPAISRSDTAASTSASGQRESAGGTSLPFEPSPPFRKSALHDDSHTASSAGRRLAILIVAYNAASTLLSVLKRITPAVWENVQEVVVMDDASGDATYEAAVGLKALLDLPKLTVIKHPRNLGYGGNQKAGYRYLIERGFEVAVLLHGDGQYAPEILSHLYAPVVRGEADAVLGSRMMPTYGGPLKGGMPLYKFVGNRILTILENRALGLNLTEFHSGYRAYSLAALKRLDLSSMTDDFHFDTEIIIKLHHQGFRIAEVPIPTYYGTEICRVDGLRYAGNVVRAVWRYRQTTASARAFPEFQEYWTHYPLKLSRYSSHGHALRLLQGTLDVLDVACGHGFLAERLSHQGCRVTGVDVLPAPARQDVFINYFQCDLFKGLSDASSLPLQSFDRVLLLDVLEHLPDPKRLLQDVRPLLRDNGYVLVSVPNVANLVVRVMLFFGRWTYADRGIMDRTHLRFFTRKTAADMLEDAGYVVVARWATIVPIDLALGIRQEGRIARLLSRLLNAATSVLPGLLGYQTMFIARRKTPA